VLGLGQFQISKEGLVGRAFADHRGERPGVGLIFVGRVFESLGK
jgi:hypothetical protein